MLEFCSVNFLVVCCSPLKRYFDKAEDIFCCNRLGII